MVSYTSELWRSAADARRECDTAALRSVFQDKSKDYQSLLMIANRTTDFKILPYDLLSTERIPFTSFFSFREFDDVPRVLVADARSFQALATILG